jgi:DNA-binding LacI/PurR family transcriptional regulator
MRDRRITIGVLINYLDEEYQCNVWNGIDQAARELGINAIFFGSGDIGSPQNEDVMRNSIHKQIQPGSFDGLIVVSTTISGYVGFRGVVDHLGNLVKSIPMVNIGNAVEGFSSISVDNRSGTRESVRHLIEVHGKRRFVYLAGHGQNVDANERKEAFLDTLDEYGLAPVEDGILDGMFRYGVAKTVFAEWIEKGIPFDAVVAANDMMAFACFEIMRDRGIRVPEDVVIVGFDDNSGSRSFTVPLTTVRQPSIQLGYSATQTLFERIVGKVVLESVSLPTTLVIRQSCGCHSPEALAAAGQAGEETAFRDLERIAPEMTAELRRAFYAINETPLGGTAFLSAFRRFLLDSEPDRFFTVLGDCVSRLERSLWQPNEYGRSTLSMRELSQSELALHQARILLKESAIAHQANRFRAQKVLNVIHQYSVVSLISASSLDRLLLRLDESLRKMGVLSYFLSLFDDEGNTTRSRLVSGCFEGVSLDLPPNGVEFDTKDIFPRELIPSDQRFAFLAESLFYEEKPLGIFVVDVNPNSGVLTNALEEQIRGALRSAMLMDELREKDQRLNAAFNELTVRADELEAANVQIRQNQQQLILAEKMATLGRLTAGMAHEMNTPLAAAMASLSEIGNLLKEYRASAGDPDVTREDHLSIADEMEQMLSLANRSVERAAGFIRSIKGQTRIGGPVGDVVFFDLCKISHDTLVLLGHAIRKGKVEVDVHEPSRPVMVLGFPDKFTQVLTNLIINSIDAMVPSGGTITVDIFEEGTNAVVSVTDTGCGIPGENLLHIFDPFYTTKPVGVGTGLGLTIVHDIVVGDFRGNIAVKSAPGAGTCFTVTIPIAKEQKSDS